jgi:ADP-ribose pyrophosphatase YjhB (NUDIX family)
MTDGPPQWLQWARKLQAVAQTGLNHATGHYDKQNYAELLALAAEITAAHSGLEQERVLESFTVQPGYATVKVDVRGAVVREGRILLVREAVDGRWCMPGGWADVGDLPSSAIAREVAEESGLVVRPFRVVGVYDANRAGRPMEFFHAFKLVMLCEERGGELKTSEETTAVDFFAFDDLPELSSHRSGPRHLADVRAMLDDPCRGAAFD